MSTSQVSSTSNFNLKCKEVLTKLLKYSDFIHGRLENMVNIQVVLVLIRGAGAGVPQELSYANIMPSFLVGAWVSDFQYLVNDDKKICDIQTTKRTFSFVFVKLPEHNNQWTKDNKCISSQREMSQTSRKCSEWITNVSGASKAWWCIHLFAYLPHADIFSSGLFVVQILVLLVSHDLVQ